MLDPAPTPLHRAPEGAAHRSPEPRGSGRGRGLYDRRRQRANERWPLAGRAAAWALGHPEAVLRLLGGRPPVRIEGRELNRGTQAMLEALTRAEGLLHRPGGGVTTPDDLRRLLRLQTRIAMPVRTDVHVAAMAVAADESPAGVDGIPVRVYRRFGVGVGDRRPPGIVYFHGGGFVMGDLHTHDASCRLLAAVSRCVVVAVDYRLAPEHPYPAAVEDATAAYRWVRRHADRLGIDPHRVGVMGDSAGGNLAAVVALGAAPEGTDPLPTDVPPPTAQGLVYPVTSVRIDDRALPYGEGLFLTAVAMEQFRDAYVPDQADWDLPDVSPLLVDDLAGAPPALVVTAGFDPLQFDGTAYAERLAESGVAVEHRHYEDQVHGFFGMGVVPDSLALATEVCDAMGRLMHRAG